MLRFILRLIIYALAVLLTAHILPGVTVSDFWDALIVAGILVLLNATIKPILVLLTIPFTVITFGLFLLVINTLIILLADVLFNGFIVEGFWWALLFSLLLSLVNSVFMSIAGERDSRRD